MPLPIKPLPIIERWDCHQCGACCRGSLVPLSADELARIKSQKWEERPGFRGTPVVVPESWLSSTYRLAHREDGTCVFLLPDGNCRLHKELGFEAKPLVCRMFPLQIVPRDNAAFVTVRRACPSAAADKGRPLSEHLDFARQLAREGKLTEGAVEPPPIKPGEPRSWRVARRLLETFQRQLTDERYPPVRRLVHATTLARLLTQAKTRALDDRRLIDLFDVLESHVAEEAAEFFSSRQPPTSTARVLFRQTVVESLRLLPGYLVRPNWRERWRLILAAWRFIRGSGQLPKMYPAFPEATFEQLEQPLGVLDPAIYQPLARMIETTGVSWSYALANRRGWSIVESVWMLSLTYPVGLWLLRWRSAAGVPRVEYMSDIIAALDRTQGYAPLAGGRQKRRLRLLSRMEQLERLVIWYAQ
jgi:lysine-N-methylase